MPIERVFESEQIAINYAEYPDPVAEDTGSPGLPLVLLHGGSARWEASLPIIPELSRHYHIYAPDIRPGPPWARQIGPLAGKIHPR